MIGSLVHYRRTRRTPECAPRPWRPVPLRTSISRGRAHDVARCCVCGEVAWVRTEREDLCHICATV